MLRERILKQLEGREIGQRQLAKVANVNESTISRYLNGHDELKFESTLKIVQYLFPQQEKEYIAEYALTQKSHNARCCLEYCLIHRLLEPMEQLISKLMDSSNPVDREWARVYELEWFRVSKSRTDEQIVQGLMAFNPNSMEARIMHKLVLGYIYYYQKKINVMTEFLKDVEENLPKIKSNFIQGSLSTRYGLLIMNVYLRKNKLKKVREVCQLLIEQSITESARGAAYHVLGHSYLFEEYELGEKYIRLALDCFTRADSTFHYQQTLYTLSFHQSYWQIEREFPFELKSHQEIDEYIFYLIQQEEKEKAKELIDQVNIENLADAQKAFYYYYLGLIEEDKYKHYESVRYFRKIQDRFYLQLPIGALIKMNENETLLKIFTE